MGARPGYLATLIAKEAGLIDLTLDPVFHRFWYEYERMHRTYAHSWRLGQTVFNAAHLVFPVETDLIRGTLQDCFYRDDKVPDFLWALFDLLTHPKL